MGKVTALDGAKITDAVYRFDPQVGGYRIAQDENDEEIRYNNPTTDLQLALYENADGNYVIAVRGTEPATYGDWDTNVRMFVSTLMNVLPTTFGEALLVINKIIDTYGLNSSNTTIVGHSMGGSIAQYLGAVKGFETLTYNAYGVGNMDMVPDGSHENITNYITMYDFVSPLLRSEMIGTTYMLQDENLTDVLGHGITNFTSIDNWVRGYSRVNDPSDIEVIYDGALESDEQRIYAKINGSKNDVIYGGEIKNTLIGGGGNDILISGIDTKITDTASDRLEGGQDYDTYISGNGDVIMDTDGSGIVYFEGEHLTGGTKQAGAGCGPTEADGSSVYYGDGGTYRLETNGVLTFTHASGKILSIEDYTNKDLGITLKDNEADGASCAASDYLDDGSGDGSEGQPCPKPVNPLFTFSIPLPTPTATVSYGGGGGGGTYYGGGGGGGGSSSYTPMPTVPHTYTPPPAPKIECVNSPVYHSAGTGGGCCSSTGPIVLDLNRDGVTSISLAASQALFDYDGDGIKENTAWTQNTDALLVNDKNGDGLINDGGELFGNYVGNELNYILYKNMEVA